MKELFLMRHAKTENAAFDRDDHSRKLTQVGQSGAKHVAEQILQTGILPTTVLSSDADRALETSEIVCGVLNLHKNTELIAALYSAGVEDVLALLAGRQEDRIMIVGHNPCMEECVETLLGELHHLRPGFCVYIRFEIKNWEDLYSHPMAETHHIYKPHD